ncbi:hypothetical protein V7O66_09700 [Methanolobus sp. ZRKC3]|uniref:hypothetical protein n=1 Tax=Methanolobus sp. ZRKC3 TaxID=3125786 RepID=UPI00324A8533
MGREFTEMDIRIFNKLAPELNGNFMSNAGHPYPFILRPISHKVVESSEDFRERLERLDAEELDHIVQLAIEGKEDIRSLDEDDIDSIMELVEEKLSTERLKEMKAALGFA